MQKTRRSLPYTLLATLLLLASTAAGEQPYHSTTVQKGDFTFTPSAAEWQEGRYDERSCPGKTCACTADIQQIQLTAHDTSAEKINAALQQQSAARCSADTESVITKPQVTFLSPAFISTLTDAYSLPRGANGSCHGEWIASLFDRTTGQELKLKDVVAAQDLPQVYQSVAAEILATQKASDPAASVTTPLTEPLTESQGNLGLFIKSDKLMVQFPGFPFSCADGNAFAGTVPTTLINNPSLRTLLTTGAAP